MLKHLKTEFVPYVEGTLSEEDSKRVEEHLRQCPACRAEMEETRHIISALEKDRTLFCPLSSDIYDFATGGSDPNGSIAKHLSECVTCRAEYVQYCKIVGRESLPAELWTGIKSRLDATSEPGSSAYRGVNIKESVIQGLSRWFRLRMMIPALIAAAVLVIFLYKPIVPNNMVGFTSVAWEKVPQPKDGGHGERRDLVYVILYDRFKEAVPQRKIDALYLSLAPSIEVVNRYRVVPPAHVSDVIKKRAAEVSTTSDVCRILAEKWGNGLAVIFTITPSTAGVFVDARLLDLWSNRQIAELELKEVPLDQLEKTLQEISRQLVMKES